MATVTRSSRTNPNTQIINKKHAESSHGDLYQIQITTRPPR
jgi:hypothetical protein